MFPEATMMVVLDADVSGSPSCTSCAAGSVAAASPARASW